MQALLDSAHKRRKLFSAHSRKEASGWSVRLLSNVLTCRKRRAAKEAAEGPQPLMVGQRFDYLILVDVQTTS